MTTREATTLNAIARSGTPCLLTRWKKRGNWPSTDIWCNDLAQPMMAFRAESARATISIKAINQFRKLPAVEKIFPANVTKIVFGSTRLELERAFAEDGDEADRDQRVDEEPVAAFE